MQFLLIDATLELIASRMRGEREEENMFYRVESTQRRASRMTAGAKTPWWGTLHTFKSYYVYNTDNWIELQVYPDAGRAFLTGYGETDGKFTEFAGQMDADSVMFGFENWKAFIEETQKPREQAFLKVCPTWKKRN